MLVSQTPYGVSDAAYYNRDRAAEAMKDAERIANLLKKKGDDLTPEGRQSERGDRVLQRHTARRQRQVRPRRPADLRRHAAEQQGR
ncbi:hypothetical protein ACH4M4_37810 [Streptomyces sp. NPDC017254]|uniref:hypothetical protein n=1 Tax=unclassified Streptomyces TaxID=2593676 RepID=UPI0037B31CCD